jgi:hypothetical protein
VSVNLSDRAIVSRTNRVRGIYELLMDSAHLAVSRRSALSFRMRT